MIPATMGPRSGADPSAFVAQHQRAVFRWLRALGCEAQRAEEHCQDALLAALHHGIDQRQPRLAAAWLRTAARNFYWLRLRRERRQPDRVALAEIEASWHAFGGDEDGADGALAALRGCLDAASDRDRQLLEQRYRDDACRRSMATALGVGETAIKQALRRARRRLQDCVRNKLDDQTTS